MTPRRPPPRPGSPRRSPGRCPLGTARCALEDVSWVAPELIAGARAADLGEEAVYLAWELARAVPGEPRLLHLLVLAVAASLRVGSTCLELGARLEPALARLGGRPGDAAALRAALAAGAFAPIVGPAGAPLVHRDGALLPGRLALAEDRLVVALGARLARRDVLPGGAAALEALGRRPLGPPLSAEQAAAVAAAAGALTVVTGGPGTGKSTIVVAVLRLLVRLGVRPERIGVAAPTGKAAGRLGESLAAALAAADVDDAALAAAPPAPVTLHRLLAYSPSRDRFLHDAANPLPLDAVIVHECSMVDLRLFARLVAAVPPGAPLILLGDAEQLPSVEAGAVFRDLVGVLEGGPALHRLTRSFRVDAAAGGGAALAAAAAALRGGAAGELAGAATAATALAFAGVERVAPGELGAFLDAWAARHFTADLLGDARRPNAAPGGDLDDEGAARALRLLAAHERFRLLAVTREVPRTGVADLAAGLHARYAARLGRSGPRLPGEPVVVARNDPRRGLANGDVGVVVLVDDGRGPAPAVAVRRGAGVALHSLAALRPVLEPGWASTVHRAQGSEHAAIALVLPETDLPLLTRELVYTAVTRARESLVLVGDAALAAAAAARPLERESGGFAARLRAQLG